LIQYIQVLCVTFVCP